MWIESAIEGLQELKEKAHRCDSHTASVALGTGKFIEAAFSSKEIDEDKYWNMLDEANKLTTGFRHECSCKKK